MHEKRISQQEILLGPRLKIARAKTHFEELGGEITSHLELPAYKPFEEEREINGRYIYFGAEVLKDPPLHEWGVIVGDIIHNLRSALDQVISNLILANGGSEADIVHKYFPIANNRTKFLASYKSQIKGVSKRTERLIYHLKPYAGGNDFLYCLHRLSIFDKHWLILPAQFAPTKYRVGKRPKIKNYELDMEMLPINTPLKGKVDMFRILIPPDAPSGKLDMDNAIDISIVFYSPESVRFKPVIETLNQLIQLTEKTLKIFTNGFERGWEKDS